MKIFEFLPKFCLHCGKEITLVKERLHQYERRGYPQYINGHQFFGNNNVMKRPEVKAKIIGRKRPDFSVYLAKLNKTEKHKEKCKIALQKYYNRNVKELLKPDLTSEIKQVLLSEQEKCKIAIQRLETQRLARIAKEKIEDAKNPKPKEKSIKAFGQILCYRENKYIKCKKMKISCSDWSFCHKKDKKEPTYIPIS